MSARCRSLLLASLALGLPLFAQEPAVEPTPSPDAAPKIIPAGPLVPDGGIHDSLGVVTTRPAPDVQEPPLPSDFQEVEYLRSHHDVLMATTYLRKMVVNPNILPQDRARAIIELADVLQQQKQQAEALCWLKVWLELFPVRPEVGAVAYRVGSLYEQMGLPDLARDAYYMSLAHTVNQGQVQNSDDLQNYTRLTTGTLWALAENEYQASQWARAAKLFARYRSEAPSATPISLEDSAYLEADCDYQLHDVDAATQLYEQTLTAHPFNPFAPHARLRLYHLYMIQHEPAKARDQLLALAWTVRTLWPQQESFWQRQTAQLLMALNESDAHILPPLVQSTAKLPPEGKTWQDLISHYDALVTYEANETQTNSGAAADSSLKTISHRGLVEDEDLMAMSRYMDHLLPPHPAASTE